MPPLNTRDWQEAQANRLLDELKDTQLKKIQSDPFVEELIDVFDAMTTQQLIVARDVIAGLLLVRSKKL